MMLSVRSLVAGLLVTLATIVLIVFSPVLVDRVGSLIQVDAQRVNQLGGGYAAASALVAAIALSVLAVSTIVQIRQTRIGQLHSLRSLQLELLRMALDSPVYRSALGADFAVLTPKGWRRHAYLNLWMMYLQMNFLIDAFDEQGVRRFLSDEFFSGQSGREYWQRARAAFTAEASTRQQKQFVRIVDEEYFKATNRPESERPGKDRKAAVQRDERGAGLRPGIAP